MTANESGNRRFHRALSHVNSGGAMDEDNWKFAALIVLGCIVGALLVLGYHAIKRGFL